MSKLDGDAVTLFSSGFGDGWREAAGLTEQLLYWAVGIGAILGAFIALSL